MKTFIYHLSSLESIISSKCSISWTWAHPKKVRCPLKETWAKNLSVKTILTVVINLDFLKQCNIKVWETQF